MKRNATRILRSNFEIPDEFWKLHQSFAEIRTSLNLLEVEKMKKRIFCFCFRFRLGSVCCSFFFNLVKCGAVMNFV